MSEQTKDSRGEDSRPKTASMPRDEYEGRARFGEGLLRRTLQFVLPHKLLFAIALVLFPLVAAV